MPGFRIKALLIGTAAVAACVTINVYFPEAAAQKAADRIINDVWQDDASTGEPQSRLDLPTQATRFAHAIATSLVPDAHAGEADFDIDTPEIRSLTAAMAARHPRLKPFYDAGAIGLTDDANIDVRDRNLVPLSERNTLRQLVADENRDRDALYRAIAVANGHPEWEANVRKTFAERWIAAAGKGWYYRASGGWQQK